MDQNYDFTSDFVTASAQLRGGLQSGIGSVATVSIPLHPQFQSPQGQILVPAPMDISQMQDNALAAFSANGVLARSLTADLGIKEIPEKKKRPKIHICRFEGCGKMFDSQWALTRHTRSHTGEKPFECSKPGCTRSFSEKCALKRHLMTHEESRPHQCAFGDCGKCFKSKEYLELHIRLHTEQDPYKCHEPNCGRLFCSPKSLRKHQLVSHLPMSKESMTEAQKREQSMRTHIQYRNRVSRLESQLKMAMDSYSKLQKQLMDIRKINMKDVSKENDKSYLEPEAGSLYVHSDSLLSPVLHSRNSLNNPSTSSQNSIAIPPISSLSEQAASLQLSQHSLGHSSY